MKIILHIGQSKTGTSAIQAYLTLNRLSLRESGVLYPSPTVKGLAIDFGNHNPLADSLVGLSRYPHFTTDEYFDQFFATAAATNASTMILSAEHFFGGEPRVWEVKNEPEYFESYREKISKLRPFLRDHQVHILVYLRPQVDWLASAIGQTVRIERLIREEPIYENDWQFFELAKPLIQYYTIMEMWSNELNPATIEAVTYDRDNLYNNDSIADFMYRAGLAGNELKYAREKLEVNQSISSEFIEVKKIINQSPHSKNEERVIIACLRAITERQGKFTPYWISEDLIQEVVGYVAAENEMLNQKYIVGGPLVPISLKGRGRTQVELTKEELDTAIRTFEKEYRGLKYRALHARIALLIYLRDNALPLHTLLHQVKRLYRKIRYRKKVSS